MNISQSGAKFYCAKLASLPVAQATKHEYRIFWFITAPLLYRSITVAALFVSSYLGKIIAYNWKISPLRRNSSCFSASKPIWSSVK